MTAKIALAALALVSAPLQAAADPARYMPAELIASTVAPKPGSTIFIGFRFTPKPGWHGYWSNPGDSGFAPSVDWTAPRAISFGSLLHPAPTLIADGGISSFVHDGPHLLLSRMTIPLSVAPGTSIPIAAKLSWAACTATQCVPLHATLSLALIAGDGAKGPEAAALASAAARLPKAAANGTFTADGSLRRLMLPASLGLDPARTRFFPADNDSFTTARATTYRDDRRLVIIGPARSAPASIGGVVTDGRSSYRLSFARIEPEPAAVEDAATSDLEVNQDPVVAETLHQSPVVPPAAVEPKAVSREPWLAIAIVALALGGSVLLLRRRKRA